MDDRADRYTWSDDDVVFDTPEEEEKPSKPEPESPSDQKKTTLKGKKPEGASK